MSVLNIVCPRPKEGGSDRDVLPQKYGSARYGMSESAWLLVVSARCALEDVIRLLRLDIPFYAPDETAETEHVNDSPVSR